MLRLVFAIALTTLASLQTPPSTSGILRGSVSDPAKARIPGVQIILSYQGAEVKKTLSDERGEYSIEAPAGTYGLIAQLPGFDTALRVVELKGSEVLQTDLTMNVKPRLPRLLGTLERSRATSTAVGLSGKWATERSKNPGSNYQAEFDVVGDKVTGTLSIGGLGGVFHVINDGKLVGNQIRFLTKVTTDREGRPLSITATTAWTVQLVDENTIELRMDREIDNPIFISPPR